MIDEIKATVWDIILACLIGAFLGLIAAQFLPNREDVAMAILIGIIIVLSLLTIYYIFLWRVEVRRERRRSNIHKRSGYSR